MEIYRASKISCHRGEVVHNFKMIITVGIIPKVIFVQQGVKREKSHIWESWP